ncbi:fasciculation and elongation protein zeta-2 [Anthonomus grandis grandis]|uniref:fasciculation and elongation protein zeta-2 n=1 Tax=Anthonomus grandis grandis TaxID=2921223 RepID=UPI0021659691|nr:fasciculation and elongation protein zeta-2 [Anthonomus grandis grandis]
MRDLAAKMAELKFEAPLAQFEETDEWGSSEFQSYKSNENEINNINSNKKLKDLNQVLNDLNEDLTNNSNTLNIISPKSTFLLKNEQNLTQNNLNQDPINNTSDDNFTETFSGSLEDLVNTFDEKITKCFGNYEESVEKLAPVQVRSQEEIMNECQMWWTITGNFGNILPIDWSKSYARKLQIDSLHLEQQPQSPDDDLDLSSEDEQVANDLDMHALILGGLQQDTEPLKTADEVIQEIDDMMQEEESFEENPRDPFDNSEVMEKAKEVLASPLYEDKLRDLSLSQLNELFLELEVLIREFSETLISELALRDELEYEKELKNTFISLLLAVQNKRRQYHVEKKRSSKGSAVRTPNGLDPKYLTTVIPYHIDNGTPDNQTLQILIKILKAINEDSPTVPTLLTDYILKVICPT